jgi:hypothetical protein
MGRSKPVIAAHSTREQAIFHVIRSRVGIHTKIGILSTIVQLTNSTKRKAAQCKQK